MVSVSQAQLPGRAIPVCSEVLEAEPENAGALKDRAEAYIQDEQYEEGRSRSGPPPPPPPPPPIFSQGVHPRGPLGVSVERDPGSTVALRSKFKGDTLHITGVSDHASQVGVST